MRIVFVIKLWMSIDWIYYNGDVTIWHVNPNNAKTFETYIQAEEFLKAQTKWGGMFEIEKIFIKN